jgi:putative hemolysin
MTTMTENRTAAAQVASLLRPRPTVTHSDISITSRLGNYAVYLAGTLSEVREAQRLRYKVFVEEFGAHLQQRIAGHDIDMFDAYCDHLIVRDLASDRVVGTYRILAPHMAKEVGIYYAESEFFLDRLASLRNGMVEVGRSCVHREHRSGAVIGLLWSGLASYMSQGGYDHLVGCASISISDGGHNAANFFASLDPAAMAPIEYQVFPRNPLPWERLANGAVPIVPPLIKGYLRAGAWICGEPAWDPDFNSADLPIVLPMARIKQRYARHFVKD